MAQERCSAWTLIYHVCLFLRLGVAWAVGLEALALAACAPLIRRLAEPEAEGCVAPVTRPPPTHELIKG